MAKPTAIFPVVIKISLTNVNIIVFTCVVSILNLVNNAPGEL